MEFTEEQIKDILNLKDQITTQIEQHKVEIENLEKNLRVLNLIIKQSSFTKASSLGTTPKLTKSDYSIPITKGDDGSVIANAYVTSEQVSIVLDESVGLNDETPPFKTFFLDRIIGGMKKKDSEEAQSGRLQKESIIDCIVKKNGSNIREIIIKNYRNQERVNEIINTATWSLSRMIENSNT
jgi:hypothetical protein